MFVFKVVKLLRDIGLYFFCYFVFNMKWIYDCLKKTVLKDRNMSQFRLNFCFIKMLSVLKIVLGSCLMHEAKDKKCLCGGSESDQCYPAC